MYETKSKPQHINNKQGCQSIVVILKLLYIQQQTKRENLLLLNWLKIQYAEYKKCILHVKLTVYYTISFTCNMQFLNSTYFILNQFKSKNFRVSFAVEYILFL